MKITKQQLRRIIKEEQARLTLEVPTAEEERLRLDAAGQSEDHLYFSALSDLEEELKNSIANALEKGLIIDDLEDAWSEAKLYIEEMG
jgi:hypothetical protein